MRTLRNDETRNLEMESIKRERTIQRQEEETKIEEARYTERYKMFETREDGYLRKERLDKGIGGMEARTMIKMRCGNLEEKNKYWKEEKERRCIFCERGIDEMKHLIKKCEKTKEWFTELGKNVEKRWERM